MAKNEMHSDFPELDMWHGFVPKELTSFFRITPALLQTMNDFTVKRSIFLNFEQS